jgi:hypothetical protein
MRLAKVASLGIVAVLAIACGGVKIPTIPPIPSFSIPSFDIPSGLDIPTPDPNQSIDPNAAACKLLTAAEVQAALGNPVTVTDSATDSCTYTASNTFATVNVRFETGDLTAARILLGDTAKDVTINGMPGLSGVFIGSPLVYVQRGGNQLVVQGVLVGSDDASVAKIVQLATTAASRWQ